MLNYKQYNDFKLNECTIVGKPMTDRFILYKQRDSIDFTTTKVVREKINDIEIVYFEDLETGWIEGMNEYGITTIHSQISPTKEHKQDPIDQYSPIDFTKKKKSEKMDEHLELLSTCKTIEEAFHYLYDLEKIPGSTFLSDGKILYEMEISTGEYGKQYLKWEIGDKTYLKEPLVVKTNHGILIPDIGYQEYVGATERHSSEIRKLEAERMLTNKKISNPMEMFSIMSFQPYEESSMMNIMRTRTEFKGINQICIDPINLEFIFNPIKKFQGIENRTDSNKIKITIYN